MIRAFRWVSGMAAVAALVGVSGVVLGQDKPEVHGRKWKPLPDEAHIVVTVLKGFNGKPIENAGVVFHATRNGQNDGNLEVKSDPDGRAVIDVIEVGSHVSVQVIASGYATSAQEIDVDSANKELVFKMQRPKTQVSEYKIDGGDKTDNRTPGVQEHTGPTVPQTQAQPPADVPRPETVGPAK